MLVATREAVSLRAEAVCTDIADFDAAIRAGDTDWVRSLYAAGPLLPAFYDDWVLAERDRLEEAHESLHSRRGSIALAVPVTPPAPTDTSTAPAGPP